MRGNKSLLVIHISMTPHHLLFLTYVMMRQDLKGEPCWVSALELELTLAPLSCTLSPCGVGILKWVSLIAGLKAVCLRGRKTATWYHTEKPCWSETSTLQSGQSIVLHLMLNEVSPVEPLPRHYGIVSMMAAQSIPPFPPLLCRLPVLFSASRRHCASVHQAQAGSGVTNNDSDAFSHTKRNSWG